MKKKNEIILILLLCLSLSSKSYAKENLEIKNISVFKDAIKIQTNTPNSEVVLYDETGAFVAKKISDDNGEAIIYVNKYNNRNKNKSRVQVSYENQENVVELDDFIVSIKDDYYDRENALSSVKKDKEVYPKNVEIKKGYVLGQIKNEKDKFLKIYTNGKYIGTGYINDNSSFNIKVNKDIAKNEKLNFYIEDSHSKSELNRDAYIVGYEENTFKPNQDLTRAEASVMIDRLIRKKDEYSIPIHNFKDVEKSWYSDSVDFVVEKDLLKGYSKYYFAPMDKITRKDFTNMLFKYIEILRNSDEKGNSIEISRIEDAIEKIYGNKVIVGYPDGTFEAKENITRAEAISILNIAFGRISSKESIKTTENISKIKNFKDVKKSDWFYIDLVDAANSHKSYRRSASDDLEIWTEVKEP